MFIIKFYCSLVISVVLAQGVQPIKSLMMVSHEINRIVTQRAAQPKSLSHKVSNQDPQCRGIVYLNPHCWQIWLNHDCITSSSLQSKYKIINVTADSVCYQPKDGSTCVILRPVIVDMHFDSSKQ